MKYYDDDRGEWGQMSLLIANVTYEEKCALIGFINTLTKGYPTFNSIIDVHSFYNEPSSLYAVVIISGIHGLHRSIRDFVDGFNLVDDEEV